MAAAAVVGADEANEQLYEAQNQFYGRYAAAMLPVGGVAAAFRQAAERFLLQHGHSALRARALAWEREVFCWASVHRHGSSHALVRPCPLAFAAIFFSSSRWVCVS